VVKRVLRITLRIFLAGLVLVAVLLVLGLEGVDYRPYFRTSYYAETTQGLRAAATTNHVVRGALEAGFGKALLTPTVKAAQDDPAQGKFKELPLAGYGNRRGHFAEGAHDDLYIKAVAIRVAGQVGVMLGADALIIPREVADAACADLAKNPGLRREQIYLSATHTHCSLGGWGQGVVAEAFAGPFQPAAREWFASRIVAAVRAAVADLKPAAFGRGSFAAPDYIRNRLIGDLGKVDPEFSFLAFKKDNGPLAILGSFSAHATVLGGSMMQFSADYPGAWQRAVERGTGGMAVFLAGGVGSQSPVPGAGGLEGIERMGTSLAAKLLEQLPGVPLTNRISFGSLGVPVAMPGLHARVTDGVRLRPWVSRHLLPVAGHSFVQGFLLDQNLWLSTPCDYSAELALGIKDFFGMRGVHAVVTSFNGDYVGYVIPGRYYHMDGYEPRVMSFFGPYTSDYLDELARTTGMDLTRATPEPH